MKDAQNISIIRRNGLYGKLVWRFGLVILMFMLIGIGYSLRAWFEHKIAVRHVTLIRNNVWN